MPTVVKITNNFSRTKGFRNRELQDVLIEPGKSAEFEPRRNFTVAQVNSLKAQNVDVEYLEGRPVDAPEPAPAPEPAKEPEPAKAEEPPVAAPAKAPAPKKAEAPVVPGVVSGK